LNDQDNDRFIFVAPKIKADLFNALKEHLEAGRLAYFRVTETDNGYEFESVNGNNLDKSKHQHIKWGKKSKKNDGSIKLPGLKRTAKDPESAEPEVQAEVQKPLEAKNAVEQEKPTELADLSTEEQEPVNSAEATESKEKPKKGLLRFLERNHPHIGDPETYLANLSVPAPLHNTLNQLADEQSDAIHQYHKEKNWQVTKERQEFLEKRFAKHIKIPGGSLDMRLDNDAHEKLQDSAVSLYRFKDELIRELRTSKTKPDIEDVLDHLETLYIELDLALTRTVNSKLYQRKLKKAREFVKATTGTNQEYVQDFIFRNQCYSFTLTKDAFALIIQRARALLDADPVLAQVYLSTCELPRSDNEADFTLITHDRVSDFLENDQVLFKHLISNFTIEEPPLYKVLQFTHPDLENPERYLKPIGVSATNKRKLEKLVMPKALKATLADYDKHSHLFVEHERRYNLQETRTLFNTPEDEQYFDTLMLTLSQARDRIGAEGGRLLKHLQNIVLVNETLEEILQSCQMMAADIISIRNKIASASRDDRLVRLGKLMRHLLERSEGQNREYLNGLLFSSLHFESRMVTDFAEVKMNRGFELLRTDSALGTAYLAYSPFLEEQGLYTNSEEFTASSHSFEPSFVRNYIEKDTQFYQRILDQLETQQEKYLIWKLA